MASISTYRTSPTNYLVGIFLLVILWAILNLLPGYLLSDEVTLNNMTSDEWLGYFLAVSGITVFLVYFLIIAWFSYGVNPEVVQNLEKAKSRYSTLFMLSLVLGIIGSVVAILLFMGEGNEVIFIFVYSLLIVLTASIGFWLITFLFSPINVEYVPFGK
ncbi:hypothetical protein MASR2M39_29860 [Ignavibacteriales bacterium]